MRRALFPLLILGLVASGCTGDRVPLDYGLETGRRLDYRLYLKADITRTLAAQTRREQVEATFHAKQEILRHLPEGGAEALMSLEPRSLFVDGEPQDVGAGQEFLVHLGPDGRVVEVRESAGAPTEALQPVGIERLLPRLRPVLPGIPVSAGDSWRSATEFTDEDGRFSLTSRSRLAQLGITGGHEAALVRTTYSSPVDRREVFSNAVADMEGRDVGAQEAWFALDGFLVRSSGDSVGTYRVSFRPPGPEAGLSPVEGALIVRLHTEMDLVSSA